MKEYAYTPSLNAVSGAPRFITKYSYHSQTANSFEYLNELYLGEEVICTGEYKGKPTDMLAKITTTDGATGAVIKEETIGNYDKLGNPRSYRGKNLESSRGRCGQNSGLQIIKDRERRFTKFVQPRIWEMVSVLNGFSVF